MWPIGAEENGGLGFVNDRIERRGRVRLGASVSTSRRLPFSAATALVDFLGAKRFLLFWTALDDFGAGFAGLGLLPRLQPDMIKIDIELLRDIHLSRAKQAIVAGIVGIARELDITVLGEGVETAEELAVLRAAGISLFQGYHFANSGLMALPEVPFLNAPIRIHKAG